MIMRLLPFRTDDLKISNESLKVVFEETKYIKTDYY